MIEKTCRICGEHFWCKGKCSNPSNQECRCFVCIVKNNIKRIGKKEVLKPTYLKEIAESVCDLGAKGKSYKVLLEYLSGKIKEKVIFS